MSLVALACIALSACTASVSEPLPDTTATGVRYVLRSPDTCKTGEPIVLQVDVFNLSRYAIFIREWSDRLACRYSLDAGNPNLFHHGYSRARRSFPCQPQYLRVAGCDEHSSEGNHIEWKGKGCAIVSATAKIGPFDAPGILKAKVSIPRTEYFVRGSTHTQYIEYDDELTIEVISGDTEKPTSIPARATDGPTPNDDER